MNRPYYLFLILFGFVLGSLQGQDVIVESGDYNLANDFYTEAVTAYENQKYSLSIIKFGRAIKYNPNNSDYFFGRASAYYELSKFDSAQADISRAIGMEEGQPDYHYRAGNICFKARQYAEAYKHYTIALENATNADVMINTTNCRYNRGICSMYLQQYGEAVRDFTSVMTEDPELKDTWYNRGVAYKNLGELALACEDFNAALQAGVHKAQVHLDKTCR